MDQESLSSIYCEISKAVQKTPELASLLHDLKQASCRYAGLRTDWALLSGTSSQDIAERRSALDKKRRLAHDALIDTCNILSRNMGRKGLNIDWRKKLGDHATREGRKTIGDFACAIHFTLAISAR